MSPARRLRRIPDPTRNAAPLDRSKARAGARGVARRSIGGAASVTSSACGAGKSGSDRSCSSGPSASFSSGSSFGGPLALTRDLVLYLLLRGCSQTSRRQADDLRALVPQQACHLSASLHTSPEVERN